jgi:uncharacterized membrane protein YgcG
MKGFWKRSDELERRLRAERPEPSSQLVESVVEQVSRRPFRRQARMRVVFVTAVSAALALSLSMFGGLSYAASAVKHAAVAVVAPVTHDSTAPGQAKKTSSSSTSSSPSSAQGQYGNKVTICHQGHTQQVADDSLPAHLAQGDTLGPC